MKELYTPTFKEQYGHLIDQEEGDHQWSVINSNLDKMITYSKDLGMVGHFYKMISICTVPVILLCIILFVRDGSMLYVGILAMLGLFLVYKSVHLSRLVADVQRPSTDMGKEQAVASKINFLESGLDTTSYRLGTGMQLYLLFAPWILILCSLFVYTPSSSTDWGVLVVSSYGLSGMVWYRLFSADLSAVKPLYSELHDVKLAYYSLLQR